MDPITEGEAELLALLKAAQPDKDFEWGTDEDGKKAIMELGEIIPCTGEGQWAPTQPEDTENDEEHNK